MEENSKPKHRRVLRRVEKSKASGKSKHSGFIFWMKNAYYQKLLSAIGLVMLFTFIFLFAWKTAKFLFVGFAAIVLGIFFSAITDYLHQRMPKVSRTVAFTLTIVAFFFLGMIFFALLIPPLTDQTQNLVTTFPNIYEKVRTAIGNIPLLARISNTQLMNWLTSQSIPFDKLMPGLLGVFSTTFGFFSSLVFILLVSLYLAAEPDFYIQGASKLFPVKMRQKFKEIMTRLGNVIRGWLLAQSMAMLFIGSATAVGLWILGIPYSLILGIFAAIMSFIPNFGPTIASIPAIILAFTDSPMKALYTIILFILIQMLEGFVVTPYAQRKVIALPAVLIFFSQVVLGYIIGFLGVIIATPFIACLIVLIQTLYIENFLENKTS